MAPGNRLDRNRPACCAAVESFVANRHRDEHKRRVSGARSGINNSWSIREELKLQASRRNVKHEQVQDDKFNNIEQENIRLLMRMQEIDRRPGIGCGAASKAAARIVLNKPQRCNSLPAMGRGSNSDARMRELRRIDGENRKMMKRLLGTKSTVSNRSMEREHQSQQRVMRMHQEHGPKMPRSRIPLPFSAMPGPPPDAESERIEGLHAEMQRRLQELQRMEGYSDDDTYQPGTTPLSACSPSAAAAASLDPAATDEEREAGGREEEQLAGGEAHEPSIERREYVGGALPEHSRLLVEKLMEEHQQQRASPSQKAEEDEMVRASEDGKDAVARILAAAEALDAQEFDPLTGVRDYNDYLSYENVVQRSRATLQAASLVQP